MLVRVSSAYVFVGITKGQRLFCCIMTLQNFEFVAYRIPRINSLPYVMMSCLKCSVSVALKLLSLVDMMLVVNRNYVSAFTVRNFLCCEVILYFFDKLFEQIQLSLELIIYSFCMLYHCFSAFLITWSVCISGIFHFHLIFVYFFNVAWKTICIFLTFFMSCLKSVICDFSQVYLQQYRIYPNTMCPPYMISYSRNLHEPVW